MSGMDAQVRVAVRILFLDPKSRVLLFEGRDLSDASDSTQFWFTAGGGVDEDEHLVEAAHRELLEETGQSGFKLVGPFHRREFDYLNHGRPQHQVEHFFAARTTQTSLNTLGWTELECETMSTWRWWTIDELTSTTVRYFPDNLAELVRSADALL